MARIADKIRIREMIVTDWEAAAQIYSQGIKTGFATFETQVPSYEVWDKAHMQTCRMVAVDIDAVIGWVALSPVSSRCVYGGVAEVSVYVGKDARGRGVGRLLMEALISQSEEQGLWSLQSGIFPDNIGSIRLHEKMGFRYIGKRERIGALHGVWKDNLLYERRSKLVGFC